MPKRSATRCERLERALDAVLPPPPTPEEKRREAEEFLDNWAADVVKEAHEARDARARGEPEQRPVDQMSGVQIMGAAVSYRGWEPPEPIRRALYARTHGEEVPGVIPAGLMAKYNACAQTVLKRAIDRFIAGTGGARDGGETTLR
jgi:hypothetical protein